MSFYSGSSGYLIYEGMKAAKVQNWQFSNSLSTLDATTLGDVITTVPSRSLTGGCRLFYYDYKSGATPKNDASTLIRKVIKADGSAPEVVKFSLGFIGEDGADKTLPSMP